MEQKIELKKYRDAGMHTYTYFWVNEKHQVISPYFDSDTEAHEWLKMNDLKFTTAGEYMDNRVILSQYFAENSKRESLVEKETETGNYYVRVKSEFGTWFVTMFTSQQEAEDYAEDWIDGIKT
jgi:hypothetical protein